jgi:hypothetical protein
VLVLLEAVQPDGQREPVVPLEPVVPQGEHQARVLPQGEQQARVLPQAQPDERPEPASQPDERRAPDGQRDGPRAQVWQLVPRDELPGKQGVPPGPGERLVPDGQQDELPAPERDGPPVFLLRIAQPVVPDEPQVARPEPPQHGQVAGPFPDALRGGPPLARQDGRLVALRRAARFRAAPGSGHLPAWAQAHCDRH